MEVVLMTAVIIVAVMVNVVVILIASEFKAQAKFEDKYKQITQRKQRRKSSIANN